MKKSVQQENRYKKISPPKFWTKLFIVLLIFAAALSAAVFFLQSNRTFVSKLTEHFPAFSSIEASLSGNHNAQKLLPAGDYKTLKKLEQSQTSVDNAMQTVNNYHKISWEELDKTAYTDALLAAMDVCIQAEARITDLKMPSYFEQLTVLTSEYINYSNKALTCWHSGSSTLNQSVMDRGIVFYKQALEYRKQYFMEFEDYLKSKGYAYEKQGDRIIYHYES